MTERVLTVLLIEDDPIQAEMVRGWLAEETSFQYIVRSVANFAMAKESMAEYDFDLVVLDLILPNGAGIALVKQVRILRPECTLLIWTGMQNDREEVDCLEALADEYVVKSSVDGEGFRRIARRWAIRIKARRRRIADTSDMTELGQSLQQTLQECERDPKKPPYPQETLTRETDRSGETMVVSPPKKSKPSIKGLT